MTVLALLNHTLKTKMANSMLHVFYPIENIFNVIGGLTLTDFHELVKMKNGMNFFLN